jgi:hypothetical protein
MSEILKFCYELSINFYNICAAIYLNAIGNILFLSYRFTFMLFIIYDLLFCY